MTWAMPWAAVSLAEDRNALPAPFIRLGANKMMETTRATQININRKNLFTTTAPSSYGNILLKSIINDELADVYICKTPGRGVGGTGRGQAVAPTMDEYM